MKNTLKAMLSAATMLLAVNVVAGEPTDQELIAVLKPIVVEGATTGQYADTATIDGLYKKYGHLKQGEGAGMLIQLMAIDKMTNKGEGEGFKFIDTIMNDTSYGSSVRQMVAIMKIQPLMAGGDFGKIKKLLDEIVAIDPSSPYAVQVDGMSQMIKSQMGGAQ